MSVFCFPVQVVYKHTEADTATLLHMGKYLPHQSAQLHMCLLSATREFLSPIIIKAPFPCRWSRLTQTLNAGFTLDYPNHDRPDSGRLVSRCHSAVDLRTLPPMDQSMLIHHHNQSFLKKVSKMALHLAPNRLFIEKGKIHLTVRHIARPKKWEYWRSTCIDISRIELRERC